KTAPVDGEGDVAERAEPVLVRERAVVPDGDRAPLGPTLEVGRIDGVRDQVDLVDLAGALDAVDDPVHHRTSADRQQGLCRRVGQRTQAGCVAAREQQRLHARTVARASDSAYGALWTPWSVTTAVISSLGVTSNAGLRAGKRSLISDG